MMGDDKKTQWLTQTLHGSCAISISNYRNIPSPMAASGVPLIASTTTTLRSNPRIENRVEILDGGRRKKY